MYWDLFFRGEVVIQKYSKYVCLYLFTLEGCTVEEEGGTRQYIFYFIVYSIHFLRMSIKVVDKSNMVKNDNKKRLSTFQQRLINFRD